MIQKNSILSIFDTCGITKVNCFHIYKKKKNFIGFFGNFLKVSTRVIIKKQEQKLRKRKIIGILTHTKFKFTKPDNSYIKYNINACVLLKKRLTPLGKFIKGPIFYNIKRKKFITSFIKCI